MIKRTLIIAVSFLTWILIPAFAKTELPADFLADKGTLLDYREGLASTIAVVKNHQDVVTLEIDRLWQGQKDVSHQIMAAHIPMMLHPHPEHILVIGAGAGQTPERFLYYPLKSLDLVDIEKDLFPLMSTYFNAGWLNDQRFSLIIEDGRNYVTHIKKKYDIISIEIGQIFRPGCASFYTYDFYRKARKRLNHNGIISQFVPLLYFDQSEYLSLIKTFIEVFPNAVLWYNNYEFLLIGCLDAELSLREKRLTLLIENEKVRKDLNFSYWGGDKNRMHNAVNFAAGFLIDNRNLRKMSEHSAMYHDDKPLLEYESARHQALSIGDFELFIDAFKPFLSHHQKIFEYPLNETELMDLKNKRELNLDNIIAEEYLSEYTQTNDFSLLLQSYKKNPYNEDVLLHLGLHYFELKHYEAALKCFIPLIKIDSNNAQAHNILGYMYKERNMPAESMYHYLKVIDGSSEFAAGAHNNLGILFAISGKLENAVYHFKKAMEIKPNFADAVNNYRRAMSDYYYKK